MKYILFLSILISYPISAVENLKLIKIGKAALEVEKVLIFKGRNQKKLKEKESKTFQNILNLISTDLHFYRKKFQVKFFNESSEDFLNERHLNFLREKGHTFALTTEATPADGGLNLNYSFYKVLDGAPFLRGKVFIKGKEWRTKGHEIADAFYQKVTKKKSIFKSKIIFVSDVLSHKNKFIKELYMMDFDGGNLRRLTRHGGVVIGPAFSFDNSKIVYSLIPGGKGRKNMDLYLLDLKTNKTRPISRKRGMNSGAIFTPDGKKVILTLSHTGNPEIFELRLQTGQLRRITRHFAADVDPSITYDGSKLAFLSNRAGKAMIYTADPRGKEKNVRRISFVGTYNASPRFSKDGKEIVFSSWLDNRFDIFKIAADGSQLYRMTKDFGSNEDPTFSNDGEFVAFSSQRVISQKKAIQDIYIMDREGEIIKRVTQKWGNCITPRWSN